VPRILVTNLRDVHDANSMMFVIIRHETEEFVFEVCVNAEEGLVKLDHGVELICPQDDVGELCWSHYGLAWLIEIGCHAVGFHLKTDVAGKGWNGEKLVRIDLVVRAVYYQGFLLIAWRLYGSDWSSEADAFQLPFLRALLASSRTPFVLFPGEII
jgi:hypothetical protein